jgi:MFS transporter, putative metabolite:H+ symporter
MLEYLEQQKKLTVNQWKIFAAATIGDMLDFFDFLLIAFVLAFILKDWNLTYGQSVAIVLASGVSAPFGSVFYGWLADKIGRRKVMIATVLSIATGLMALTPEHGWVCRFLIGFGVTGLYTVDIAVVQEFVPASKRGSITGVTTTMLPAGFLFGGGARAIRRALSAGAGCSRSGSCHRIEPADPRLGAQIAALANRRRPPRRCSPIPRPGR